MCPDSIGAPQSGEDLLKKCSETSWLHPRRVGFKTMGDSEPVYSASFHIPSIDNLGPMLLEVEFIRLLTEGYEVGSSRWMRVAQDFQLSEPASASDSRRVPLSSITMDLSK